MIKQTDLSTATNRFHPKTQLSNAYQVTHHELPDMPDDSHPVTHHARTETSDSYQVTYHELTEATSSTLKNEREIDSLGTGFISETKKTLFHFLSILVQSKSNAILPFASFFFSLLSHIQGAGAVGTFFLHGSPPNESPLCSEANALCEEGYLIDSYDTVYARLERTLVELTTNVDPSDLERQAHCIDIKALADYLQYDFTEGLETCTTAFNATDVQNIRPGLFFSALRGAGSNQAICKEAAGGFRNMVKNCMPPTPPTSLDREIAIILATGIPLATIGLIVLGIYCMRRRCLNQERAAAEAQAQGHPPANDEQRGLLHEAGVANYGSGSSEPAALNDLEAQAPSCLA